MWPDFRLSRRSVRTSLWSCESRDARIRAGRPGNRAPGTEACRVQHPTFHPSSSSSSSSSLPPPPSFLGSAKNTEWFTEQLLRLTAVTLVFCFYRSALVQVVVVAFVVVGLVGPVVVVVGVGHGPVTGRLVGCDLPPSEPTSRSGRPMTRVPRSMTDVAVDGNAPIGTTTQLTSLRVCRYVRFWVCARVPSVWKMYKLRIDRAELLSSSSSSAAAAAPSACRCERRYFAFHFLLSFSFSSTRPVLPFSSSSRLILLINIFLLIPSTSSSGLVVRPPSVRVPFCRRPPPSLGRSYNPSLFSILYFSSYFSYFSSFPSSSFRRKTRQDDKRAEYFLFFFPCPPVIFYSCTGSVVRHRVAGWLPKMAID